ncbi:hypothetical protein VTP01DRAFT_2462 [Rhizomucor pusillus]|uniref:uncharacterized protein n=1 Tax=Rhizomucor pusillus TaxID=4840 RepID=UPI00374490D1
MKGEARPLPSKSVCNTLLFCLVSPSLIPSVEQHGHRFFGTSDTVKCLIDGVLSLLAVCRWRKLLCEMRFLTQLVSQDVPYNPLTCKRAEEELLGAHDRWYNNAGDEVPTYEEKDDIIENSSELKPPVARPPGLRARENQYLLRPAYLSITLDMFMFQNKQYGWEIFQAIEEYCKTSSGYSAIQISSLSMAARTQ